MNRRNLVLTFGLTLLSLIVIAIVLVFPVSGPELIHNGSFESPNPPPGGTTDEPLIQGCLALCGGSRTLTDWIASRQGANNQNCDDPQAGGAHDAIAWCGPDTHTDVTAFDGTHFLDLTGIFDRPPAQFGQVEQSIEMIKPGRTYDLSFVVGSGSKFQPNDPPHTPEIGVNVEVVGVTTVSKDAMNPTSDPSHWDQHTITFRAITTPTTIRFSGTGRAGSNNLGGEYVGLDNVSLRQRCFLVEQLVLGECR